MFKWLSVHLRAKWLWVRIPLMPTLAVDRILVVQKATVMGMSTLKIDRIYVAQKTMVNTNANSDS